MSIKQIIDESMTILGLNYAFLEWTDTPKYPYFVGEYTETEPLNEDGMQETTFILTGFSRGDIGALDIAKEKIEKYFNKVSGKIVISEEAVVAIFYGSAFYIRQEDADLKVIQINLQVKEWKVI